MVLYKRIMIKHLSMNYSLTYFLIFNLLLFINIENSSGQLISEDFEGSFPPVGWLVDQNNCGDQVYWWQTDGEYDVCNGDKSALILGSDIICGVAEDWLITPQLAPTNDNHIFSFLAHQSYYQEHGSIYTLRVSTTSATDLNNFSVFYTWDESQMPTNCTMMNFDFSAYIGDSVYIAFVMENDAGDNWIIDDVSGLPLVGNCYPPTGLETFDVISTSAGLRWDKIDTIQDYFWEIVPKGNSQGAGIIVSSAVSDTFDIASPLQISTDFDYRVKSVCLSGANSYFSPPNSFTTLGNPPINDECLNAIALTVNNDNECNNMLNSSNLDATKSMDACQGVANDDVWYSFVASSDKHEIQILNLTAVKGSSIDIIHEIFMGDCSSLYSVLCSDENISTLTGLIVGETYYLRIYSKYNTSNQSFDICIKTPPPSPVNDECLNSFSVQVNSDETCSAIVSGTTAGATQSIVGCQGTADDDVWYSFVATSVKHSFRVSNVIAVEGSNTDMIHEIFSGDCSNLVSLKCSDSNLSSVTGLVIGDLYYIRIYSKYSNSRQNFDFCITTPPLPPINDVCQTAIGITVGEYGSCLNNKVICSTENATNTMYGNCDSSGEDPDLWYSFSVSVAGNYSFSSIKGNPGISLYTGDCNNLYEISCINNVNGTLIDLSPGIIYFARIYTDFPQLEVEFCIEKDISPENNFCTGAELIDVGSGYCDGITIGSNQYATNSFVVSPDCGNYAGGDLWYKFIVPLSGEVEIEISRSISYINGAMAVYSGNCNALNLLDCDSNSNSNIGTSLMPHLSLSTQVPGDTLYIRVWDEGNNSFGDFSICIWDPIDLDLSIGANCEQGIVTQINNSIGNTYTWVPLKDILGKILGFVYPNGNELGNVTPTIFTRDILPLRVDGNGIPYINRDIEISVENQPISNNAIVRLLYTYTEMEDLKLASNEINSVGDMNLTKSSEPCSGVYIPQGVFYSQVDNKSVNSNGDRYLQFQIPNFSSFYIHGGAVALPLELIELSGFIGENINILNWSISVDETIDSVVIQKSKNGVSGFLDMYNLDIRNHKGSFKDLMPYEETFYRLKVFYLDGKESISRTISLKQGYSNEFIQVFPIPSKGLITVKTSQSINSFSKAIVYSLTGKVVKIISFNETNNSNIFDIDISNEKSGIYHLKLISNDRIYMKKFVMIK